ncbi:uncharacterized protein IL334_003912 [Kwoniella shivajii]|uniref:Protein CPL1-like domain-containing protein n=1 Tax=Kwoniella shivajii TaxID=564305 RepID=A0ABZ1D053_9TREE|nr:hypothetical protein IL334_003912 [Kwoniella shivajii]
MFCCVLLLLALIDSVWSYAYVGCFSRPQVLNGQVAEWQSDDSPWCPDLCASQGKLYAYHYSQWRGGPGIDQFCLCTNSAPDYQYMTNGWEPCDPGYDTPGDVGVTAITPSWNFIHSYPPLDVPQYSIPVDDVFDCFSLCSNSQYARMYFIEDNSQGECACYDNDDLWSNEPFTTCRYNDFNIWQRSISPSAFAKRRNHGAKRLDQKKSFCPKGLTACSVIEGDLRGYECVDTASDLESRGGCSLGQHEIGQPDPSDLSPLGIGCTAIPGVVVNSVTCLEGTCFIGACEEGFILQHNSCLPT